MTGPVPAQAIVIVGAGDCGTRAAFTLREEGWDGRIVLVGLAAVLGFVTFAYLALTAYLGWLLCRASVSGWLAVRQPPISEGGRR